MGGVYAQPNLRGGGEYGEAWHQAGTKLKKQNVFDDFIAAAQWLIAERYTRPDKLAIQGGSNGGLLVGAVMTQRPDLFGACLPAVGVMDMLSFHKFTEGRLWVDDYGSADDPQQFKALRAYSPYHNIRPGTRYPATLVTTADTDDRVIPGHSFKFIAALAARPGRPGASADSHFGPRGTRPGEAGQQADRRNHRSVDVPGEEPQHEIAAMTASLLNSVDVEHRATEIGRELLDAAREYRAGPLSARFWSDRLMHWAMKDPTFKVQLFRFIDVFPMLRTPAQVHEYLRDYLSQPGVTMPAGMEFGLKAGRLAKGLMAKTIAGQITAIAHHFIAGTDVASALPTLQRLWHEGVAFSVDLLGEACVSDAEARAYQRRYLDLIETLPAAVAALAGPAAAGERSPGPRAADQYLDQAQLALRADRCDGFRRFARRADA